MLRGPGRLEGHDGGVRADHDEGREGPLRRGHPREPQLPQAQDWLPGRDENVHLLEVLRQAGGHRREQGGHEGGADQQGRGLHPALPGPGGKVQGRLQRGPGEHRCARGLRPLRGRGARSPACHRRRGGGHRPNQHGGAAGHGGGCRGGRSSDGGGGGAGVAPRAPSTRRRRRGPGLDPGRGGPPPGLLPTAAPRARWKAATATCSPWRTSTT